MFKKILKKSLVGLALVAVLGAALGLIVRNKLATTTPPEQTAAATDSGQESAGGKENTGDASGSNPADASKTNLPKSNLLDRWSSKPDDKPPAASVAKASSASSSGTSSSAWPSSEPTTVPSTGASEKSTAKASSANSSTASSAWPATAAAKGTTPNETNPKKQPGAAAAALSSGGTSSSSSVGAASRWTDNNENKTAAKEPATTGQQSNDSSPKKTSAAAANDPFGAGAKVSEGAASLAETSISRENPAKEGPARNSSATENATKENSAPAGGAWHTKITDFASGIIDPKDKSSSHGGPARSQPEPSSSNSNSARSKSSDSAWTGVDTVDDKLDKLAANTKSRLRDTTEELANDARNAVSRTRDDTASSLDENLDKVRGNLQSDRALGALKKWADGNAVESSTDEWPSASANGNSAGNSASHPLPKGGLGGAEPTDRAATATPAKRNGASSGSSPDSISRWPSADTSSSREASNAVTLPPMKRPASNLPDKAAPRDFGSLPARNSVRPATPASNAGRYEVKLDDSYWTIAKTHYGTGSYFGALYEHNKGRLADPDHLEVGDVLLTPSVEELREMFPNLAPTSSLNSAGARGSASAGSIPSNARSSTLPDVRTGSQPPMPSVGRSSPLIAGGTRGRSESPPPTSIRNPSDLLKSFPEPERTSSVQGGTYSVRQGDTLFKIAREQLGSASRWVELYELNRDILGDDLAVRPGLELSLPGESSASATLRSEPR